MGHVNNAVIATYFEQARIEALTPILRRLAPDGLDIVVARVAIDYRRELHYPGVVEIGTRIGRFGTRSCMLASELFVGDIRYASCEATVVFFDTATRASALPPADLRAAIEAIGV